MAAKLALLLAIVYTIALTVASLIQLGDLSVGAFSPTDKMLHTGASFVLALVWMLFYLLRMEQKKNYVPAFLVISVLVIIFGILIEVLQGVLTTYRQPDWADVVANSIGVLLALSLSFFFKKFLIKLKHKINLFL
ncbi:VanZ family protein [Gillisia limnaea]|uniref:VanZ family protein n=1 Tax=Gillisia limnaea (strain DSM 15749 / LMG 21470 / R-8282) TaxID=865937 RepID=H2BYH0_GILLR|nr:VanZ family protein [Gillisia limnaea]EHQ03309.1 VanZ family protein [Gillisia limnaea DSM 15749]